MQLTLEYRGTIDVGYTQNSQYQLSSAFQRGTIRVRDRWAPGMGTSSSWRLSELYVSTDGSDESTSDQSVDASLRGFLERNAEVLSSALEAELRDALPDDCSVSVRLQFGSGSVTVAAMVTLMLTGNYVVQREILKYVEVITAPIVTRVLKVVVLQLTCTGPTQYAPLSIQISLDPESAYKVEQLVKWAKKREKRLRISADQFTREEFHRSVWRLLAGLSAIALAFAMGVAFRSSWIDAARHLFTP
jgi:hypothetical protein